MAVEIRLLGGLEIAADRRLLALPTRKAEALLARLALRPGIAGRARRARGAPLAGPPRRAGRGASARPSRASGACSRTVGRQARPQAATPSRSTRAASPSTWRASRRPSPAASSPRPSRCTAAPSSQAFPPVEDTFDAWVDGERAALGRRLLAAIRGALASDGAEPDVLALADAALSIDPAFEEGWRARMRVLVARGDRAGALREYERCREALRRELSVAPAPATEILRREIAGARRARRRRRRTRTPTLAVLPFEILSADPAHEPFARGLEEDVIGALSRFRTLRVVAPRSGRREVATAGVTTTSSRRSEPPVAGFASPRGSPPSRPTPSSGRSASRATSPIRLRCRIGWRRASPARCRSGSTRRSSAPHRSARRSRSRHTRSGCAGCSGCAAGPPRRTSRRGSLFEQALALDRDYARAWAGLSLSYFNDWSCAAWERWDETERKAFEHAAEATRRDPQDPVTQCILGRILLYRREFERAAEHLARAHALNPNEPDVLAHLSLGHAYLGEPERGLALGETARRLNPTAPDWYLPCVAANHLVARRPREGLELLARAPDGHVDTRAFMAAARAHLGDSAGARQDARRFVERFRASIVKGKPFAADEPVRWVLHVNPLRRAGDREWLVEGLARAGLPVP